MSERNWLDELRERLLLQRCPILVAAHPWVSSEQLTKHNCHKCGKPLSEHEMRQNAHMPIGRAYAIDVESITSLDNLQWGGSEEGGEK